MLLEKIDSNDILHYYTEFEEDIPTLENILKLTFLVMPRSLLDFEFLAFHALVNFKTY